MLFLLSAHLVGINEGKVILHTEYPDKMKESLSHFRRYINNLSTVLQSRTLYCLEAIFREEHGSATDVRYHVLFVSPNNLV